MEGDAIDMKELLDILNKVKSGIDYVNEKHLVSDELIDSLDVMTIVTEICDEFDVEILPTDVVPENFESVEAMQKLIAPEAYWTYVQEQYNETKEDEIAAYNQTAASLVEYWRGLYGSNVQVTFSVNSLEQQSDAAVAELNTSLKETGCVVEQAVVLTVTQKLSGSAGEAETMIQPTMIQVEGNWYLIDPAIDTTSGSSSSSTSN